MPSLRVGQTRYSSEGMFTTWLVFKEDAKQQRDTCGDEWEIVWKPNFDSDAKRKDQRRGDTASLRKAVTMGHVRIRETAINTRTGFKIGNSYGLLPGLANTDRGEVPGHNTCFFYALVKDSAHPRHARDQAVGGSAKASKGPSRIWDSGAPSHHHCGLPAAKPWFSTRSTP